MHQTMLNILKVYAKTQMINTYKDAQQHVIDHAIATSIHATCCAVNHTMQHSPGEIVFQRDMLLDIPVIAGLVAVRERRKLLIDENLEDKMRKELSTIIKLGIMFGSRSMILPREMTSSMGLIKSKRQELMELLLSSEMKKVMFWKLIISGSFNLTKVNQLNQEQDLYIKEKVKLTTSLFTKS